MSMYKFAKNLIFLKVKCQRKQDSENSLNSSEDLVHNGCLGTNSRVEPYEALP